MRISESTSVEALTNLKTTAESLKNKIGSIHTKYVDSVESLGSAISNVQYDPWQDDVQVALKEYVDGLKTGCLTAIYNDVNSGGFAQIERIAPVLYEDVSTLITKKNKLAQARREHNPDITSPNYRDNSGIISSLNRQIQELVSNINNYLAMIESAQFGAQSQVAEHPTPTDSGGNPLSEANDNKDKWHQPTSFQRPGAHRFYDYTAEDGTKVTICADGRNKNPIYYRTMGEDGKLHYYDTNFNEITQEQADALEYAFNASL
jgi:hypothetical protein